MPTDKITMRGIREVLRLHLQAGLAALDLGVERPDPQIMKHPPRPQGERLMNWPLALRANHFPGLVEAAVAIAAFLFVLNGAGWKYGQSLAAHERFDLHATTAWSGTIIVMQIVNGLRGNRSSVFGEVSEIAVLLVIDYNSWDNALLARASMGAGVWGFITPFAIGMFLRKSYAIGSHGSGSGKSAVVGARRSDIGAQPGGSTSLPVLDSLESDRRIVA